MPDIKLVKAGLILFIILSISTFCVSCESTSALKKVKKQYPEIKIEKYDVKIPKKLPVYRIIPQDASHKEVRHRARLFIKDLDNRAITLNEKGTKLFYVDQNDSTRYFSINKNNTNNLDFCKGMSYYLKDNPVYLPEKNKAIMIAREFIKKYQFNLNMDDLAIDHLGYLKSASLNDPTKITNKLIVAEFFRKINGYKVFGPGSKAVVQIGHRSELVKMNIRWSPATQSQKMLVQTKSIAQAHSTIKEDMLSKYQNAKKIYVDALELAYYDQGLKYIQPIIVYHAKISQRYGNLDDIGFVPLAKVELETIGKPEIKRLPTKALKKTEPKDKAE